VLFRKACNNYLRAVGRKVLWSSACVCLSVRTVLYVETAENPMKCIKGAEILPGAAVTKSPPPVIFCQVGVSHIYVIFMWLSRSRQSCSCRLKSVIFVVAAAISENCNEWSTEIKTKFVSLIAKIQNKTCCWFHSFTLFTGNAIQPYNIVACTVSMATLAHVMSTIFSAYM